MRLSLTKKLVFGGILLVATPFLILGWYATNTASKGLTESGERVVYNMAQQLAQLSDLAMEEELKIAWELAHGNATIAAAQKVAANGIPGATDEIAELTRKFVAFGKTDAGKDYEFILAIDLNGAIIATQQGAGSKALKINVADRSYFQSAKSGKASAEDVVISKSSGKPVAVVAVPIKNPDTGRVIGVLANVINIDFLIKKVSGFKVGETGYGWMVNRKGDFIAHPNPEVALKENITRLAGMESVSRRMLAGEKGIINYEYKGEIKTCGFAPVSVNNWSVAFTQNQEEFMSSVTTIRKGMWVIGIISLSIALALVIFSARSISKPVSQVSQGLNEASDQVSSAATEVSTSSQQLAESATEQAASIEEISASLEEITSMSRANAQNAHEADGLTKTAIQVVTETSGVMEKVTTSMQEISEASNETSKIIKTIDEIAFQTNLLALNAAVEAARAGDAGAGFAVVADEVRNLAMRAAEAAKSTQSLIENTMVKVNTGGELVGQSSGAFTKVTDSTTKVAELMAEIAEASNEQAQGVDQINNAVLDMEKVTQAIAAGAEESAAASEEMYGQAESMHAFVSDLMTVVNGGGNAGNSGPMKFKRPVNRKPSATPGNGAGHLKPQRAPEAPARSAADPAQVIPLDDDFTDF